MYDDVIEQICNPLPVVKVLNHHIEGSSGGCGGWRATPLSRPHELWQADERQRVLEAGALVTSGTSRFDIMGDSRRAGG